jgi:8-oxo-dGTP pyrophosphatase MutT (NUDIX family)
MTAAFRSFHIDDAPEPAGATPLEVAARLVRRGLMTARAGGGRIELAAGAPLETRLDDIRAELSGAGLIGPPRGEAMPLRLTPEGAELARIDRSAVRILGLWVDKVHINGLVAQPDGPPQVWLSRRAPRAEWNPDRFDTLVAGGRAAGRGIAETAAAEAWEEAGITADRLDGLRPAGRMSVTYVTARGLHREVLVIFDLALDPGFRPACHDAEIARHRCLPLDALARLTAEAQALKFASLLVCRDLLGRLAAPRVARDQVESVGFTPGLISDSC